MPRPFQHGILGPLFVYDLVASTRKGQHLGLRLLVAIVLLAGLYMLYVFRGFDPFDDLFNPSRRVSAREMATLAEGFAATCLIVQFAMVLLLTPPVIGEAIAREKERRSLEFLFVTELTDREIIVGKLGARLLYLIGVLLTSLPILALTWLFGGVDPIALLASYAVMLTVLLSLGSITMLLSVWARSALEATLCAYFIAGCYLAAFPCVLFPVMGGDDGVALMLVVSIPINLLVTVVCLTLATRELRARAVPPGRPRTPDSAAPTLTKKREPAPLVREVTDPAAPDEPQMVVYVQGVRRRPPPRRRPRVSDLDLARARKPRVGDRPLLWKELYFHSVTRDVPTPQREVVMGLCVMIVLFIGVLWLAWLMDPLPRAGSDVPTAINGAVRFFTVVLAGILALGVIAHTAGSVTREREGDTLVGLLTIPAVRASILEAKWLAAFLGLRGLMVTLGIVWLIGLMTGALHPVSLLWVMLSVAGPLECVASLGIWLSVVNRTTLRANMAAALCMLMIACGPWLVMNYVQWLSPYGWRSAELSETITAGLMPPVAWVQAAVTWEDYAKMPEDTRRAILTGALMYSAFAWLLWRAACQRFGREKLGKR